MEILIGKKMLFLTSWPNGKLIPVKILGFWESDNRKIYIEYFPGATDTTTKDFLFDLPKPPKEQ